MLEKFIPQLIQDLELGNISLATKVPGVYVFPLDKGVTIQLTDMPNGFMLKCELLPFPNAKEEMFATQAMLANLFGQGTAGAVLGLTFDTNMLTLTRVIDYSINYKDFREVLEDFINSVDFWRDEALSYK